MSRNLPALNTTKVKPFWHKPAGEKTYHLYSPTNGDSACLRWMMVGFGMPSDATARKPKRACSICAKKVTK